MSTLRKVPACIRVSLSTVLLLRQLSMAARLPRLEIGQSHCDCSAPYHCTIQYLPSIEFTGRLGKLNTHCLAHTDISSTGFLHKTTPYPDVLCRYPKPHELFSDLRSSELRAEITEGNGRSRTDQNAKSGSR